MTNDEAKAELSFATLDQLIHELHNRVDSVGGTLVLAYDLPGKTPGADGDGQMTTCGCASNQLGLAAWLSERVRWRMRRSWNEDQE